MSNFRVELNDPNLQRASSGRRPVFEDYEVHPPRSKKPFIIVATVFAAILGGAAIAMALYYSSFEDTPQYSLALLVDAAERNDKAAIDALVDIDRVVDDFVPQITEKAVDLYGRGQPPHILSRVQEIAKPLLPAVKDRARAELPRVIRDRTARLGYLPFSAMVIGADRYLNIKVEGDQAVVTSKLADHPLEVKMNRRGNRWQIVGVSDEQLATDIARKIGQEIISIATNGGRRTADKYGGMGNLAELLRQAEELVR
jgi:hypothetical protein